MKYALKKLLSTYKLTDIENLSQETILNLYLNKPKTFVSEAPPATEGMMISHGRAHLNHRNQFKWVGY